MQRAGFLNVNAGGVGGGIVADGNTLTGRSQPAGDATVVDVVTSNRQIRNRCAAVLPCSAIHLPLRSGRDGAAWSNKYLQGAGFLDVNTGGVGVGIVADGDALTGRSQPAADGAVVDIVTADDEI